jgi:hypothetical protein
MHDDFDVLAGKMLQAEKQNFKSTSESFCCGGHQYPVQMNSSTMISGTSVSMIVQ